MEISSLYTVSAAAMSTKVPRQTLLDAISRGDVPSRRTADGLPLVTLDDVQKFKDNPPRRGRRPRKQDMPPPVVIDSSSYDAIFDEHLSGDFS